MFNMDVFVAIKLASSLPVKSPVLLYAHLSLLSKLNLEEPICDVSLSYSFPSKLTFWPPQFINRDVSAYNYGDARTERLSIFY